MSFYADKAFDITDWIGLHFDKLEQMFNNFVENTNLLNFINIKDRLTTF